MLDIGLFVGVVYDGRCLADAVWYSEISGGGILGSAADGRCV